MSLNFDLHRVLQFFWDPIPKNDDLGKTPVWCLGSRYKNLPLEQRVTVTAAASAAAATAAAREARAAEAARMLEAEAAVTHSEGASSDTRKDGADAPGDTATTTNDDSNKPGVAGAAVSQEPPIPVPNVDDAGWPLVFLDDVEAKLWMTYRNNFPIIPRSQNGQARLSLSTRIRNFTDPEGFTSDTGWGCMIRSGQSVVANTLSILDLGREWRRGMNPDGEKKLISLFADDPQAPFSVHKFVQHADLNCGLPSGEWFGPSVTANCIKALVEAARPDLGVYLTDDEIYEDKFFEVARNGGEGSFRPTLVMIPTRLGIEIVTPVYWEALKSTLTMPQSVGIAGGRPSSSHYFIGVQGQYLFYLDPHSTRSHIPYRTNPRDYTVEEVDSCHTRRLRRIHIKEMDPSMLLAFLIKDEKDWTAWRQGVKEVQGKRIVRISDKKPETKRPPEEALAEVEALDSEGDEGEEEGEGERISESEINEETTSERASEADVEVVKSDVPSA